MRRQKPVYDRHGEKIERFTVASGVLDAIADAVSATARRFNVSRSFVISVALADFFGIEVERFTEPREPGKRPKRKRRKRSK